MRKKIAIIVTAMTLIGTGIVSGNQGGSTTPATSVGNLLRSWPEECNAIGQIPHCVEGYNDGCHVHVSCHDRRTGKFVGSFLTRAKDAPSDCKEPDNREWWTWEYLERLERCSINLN